MSYFIYFCFCLFILFAEKGREDILKPTTMSHHKKYRKYFPELVTVDSCQQIFKAAFCILEAGSLNINTDPGEKNINNIVTLD